MVVRSGRNLARTLAGTMATAPARGDEFDGYDVAVHQSHAGCPLSWDITEVGMTDMLIRDVPDEVIAALDEHAARLGLSRSEYVRRRLAQDAATPGSAVSVQDLARFADVFSDLADPEVMSRAWQ
jgi:plasmid stability protein